MPQISSVAAATPTTPAPAAGVAPATPATSDQTPLDFVGQLSAALTSLKGLAAAVSGQPTMPGQPAASDDASANDVVPATNDQATDGTDKPSDEVLALLASLGIVLVPNAQTAPLPGDDPANASATVGANAPRVSPTLPQAAQPRHSAKTSREAETAPAEAVASPATSATSAMPATSGTSATPATATPATPAADGATQQPAAAAATPRDAGLAVLAAETPTNQPVPRPQAGRAPVPSAGQLPTAAQQASTAQLTTVQPQPQFQGSSDGGSQQGTADDRHLRGAAKAEAIDATTPAQAVPLPEHLAVSGLNAPTVVSEAPIDPQAANVATQIAQQVDFYKLPGNKGVRIQLHPDDLGGVQVTLRYAPGGNLELHINVEHASTGSLVEAGWSQLRDALATQGFQPDRLVMSVSGPSSASQMDFSSSNGNGAYRQDSGLAGFTQDGHSGQQRNGADDARGTRGRSSAAEPIGAVDDSPRNVSSVGAAASRIDYRV
jgi:flagellar hook-length control protein FliK